MSAKGIVFARAGLALSPRNVVLPGISRLIASEGSRVSGDDHIVGDKIDPFPRGAHADHLPDPLAPRQVAVTVLDNSKCWKPCPASRRMRRRAGPSAGGSDCLLLEHLRQSKTEVGPLSACHSVKPSRY